MIYLYYFRASQLFSGCKRWSGFVGAQDRSLHHPATSISLLCQCSTIDDDALWRAGLNKVAHCKYLPTVNTDKLPERYGQFAALSDVVNLFWKLASSSSLDGGYDRNEIRFAVAYLLPRRSLRMISWRGTP